jgi:hypothetical protein
MPIAAARRQKIRFIVALAVGGGLLALALANLHLVYVAVSTQPDCVAHLKRGESASVPGSFSAARSAC